MRRFLLILISAEHVVTCYFPIFYYGYIFIAFIYGPTQI